MAHRAALLSGFALAATVAFPPAASAHVCEVTALTPQNSGTGVLSGTASAQCSAPTTGLKIYVCIEIATAPSLWGSYGCTSRTSPATSFVSGSATVNACTIGSTPLAARTAAYVVNDQGQHDYGESMPVRVLCLTR